MGDKMLPRGERLSLHGVERQIGNDPSPRVYLTDTSRLVVTTASLATNPSVCSATTNFLKLNSVIGATLDPDFRVRREPRKGPSNQDRVYGHNWLGPLLYLRRCRESRRCSVVERRSSLRPCASRRKRGGNGDCAATSSEGGPTIRRF